MPRKTVIDKTPRLSPLGGLVYITVSYPCRPGWPDYDEVYIPNSLLLDQWHVINPQLTARPDFDQLGARRYSNSLAQLRNLVVENFMFARVTYDTATLMADSIELERWQ